VVAYSSWAAKYLTQLWCIRAGVWRINDGKLVKRLTDTRKSGSVVSHIEVTPNGRYVIAVRSRGGHVATPDHVIVYDVNTEQVLFDDCTQSNIVQVTTTDDSDKVPNLFL